MRSVTRWWNRLKWLRSLLLLLIHGIVCWQELYAGNHAKKLSVTPATCFCFSSAGKLFLIFLKRIPTTTHCLRTGLGASTGARGTDLEASHEQLPAAHSLYNLGGHTCSLLPLTACHHHGSFPNIQLCRLPMTIYQHLLCDGYLPFSKVYYNWPSVPMPIILE